MSQCVIINGQAQPNVKSFTLTARYDQGIARSVVKVVVEAPANRGFAAALERHTALTLISDSYVAHGEGKITEYAAGDTESSFTWLGALTIDESRAASPAPVAAEAPAAS